MLFPMSVENWMLVAGIGLPLAVLMVFTLGCLVRRMRTPKDGPAVAQIREQRDCRQVYDFEAEIQRQLIVQQVDKLLAEIGSLVQEQRARLASIADGNRPGKTAAGNRLAGQGVNNPETADSNLPEAEKVSAEPETDPGQMVLELQAKGLPPEQIAKTLELSVAEVELMIKFAGGGSRLESRSRRPISALA